MMPNSKPWQTIVNNNNLVKSMGNGTPLMVVKKNGLKNVDALPVVRISQPKRYSFDNNGGSYQGL